MKGSLTLKWSSHARYQFVLLHSLRCNKAMRGLQSDMRIFPLWCTDQSDDGEALDFSCRYGQLVLLLVKKAISEGVALVACISDCAPFLINHADRKFEMIEGDLSDKICKRRFNGLAKGHAVLLTGFDQVGFTAWTWGEEFHLPSGYFSVDGFGSLIDYIGMPVRRDQYAINLELANFVNNDLATAAALAREVAAETKTEVEVKWSVARMSTKRGASDELQAPRLKAGRSGLTFSYPEVRDKLLTELGPASAQFVGRERKSPAGFLT